jgi:hypothetical protein
MATDAQIAANRANSKKSTGPRSRAGKASSAMNALVHSMRAKKEKLLQGQSYETENRRHKWMSIESPADDIGEFYVNQRLCAAIELERAQGALGARIKKQIRTSDEKALEDVLELGQQLYFDRCGPTPMYGCEPVGRIKKKTSFSGEAVDPGGPDKIVRALQRTALGCQWLLEQWESVREQLEPERIFQAPDRLKAIRLLGANPADSPQNRDVALVFVASHAIHRAGKTAFEDLRGEMPESQILWVHRRVKERWPELFDGKGAAEFREDLIALAEENIEELQELLAGYMEQSDEIAEESLDELMHDDGPHGERQRNYINKCSGAVSRWDAVFHKHEGKQKDARLRREGESRDPEPRLSLRPDAVLQKREDQWREAERLASEMWPARGERFERETGTNGGGQPGGLLEMTDFVVRTDGTASDLTTTSETVAELLEPQPELVTAREDENRSDSSHADADAASPGEAAVSDSGAKNENATNEANFKNEVIMSESQELVEVAAKPGVVSELDKVAESPVERRRTKALSMKRERRLKRRALAKQEVERRALEMLKRGETSGMKTIERLNASPASGAGPGASKRGPSHPSLPRSP